MDILDIYAEAFGMKPPAPPDTPDQRFERKLAGAGIGVVAGNPLRDPLFMEGSKAAEREYVIREMDAWSEHGGFCHCDHSLVFQGKRMSAFDVWNLQHRSAYEALKRRANVREIAANLHLTLEQVEKIKQEFEL